MQRICKLCRKTLATECPFCGPSGHVRPSRTHPGTLNCYKCHRAAMPIGKPELTVCLECERTKGAHQE